MVIDLDIHKEIVRALGLLYALHPDSPSALDADTIEGADSLALYEQLERSFHASNKKYTYTFDGDDQLAELNTDITDLTNENQQLRRRISALKNDLNKLSQ